MVKHEIEILTDFASQAMSALVISRSMGDGKTAHRPTDESLAQRAFEIGEAMVKVRKEHVEKFKERNKQKIVDPGDRPTAQQLANQDEP